jgi:transcriptional regulator with XRE-family HTH domain
VDWATWLRTALNTAGMTAADLSRTGVVKSESTISKWLRGPGTPDDADTVIAVAHAVGQPNAIAALEASGRLALADAIRSQIRQAYEDEALVKIRTSPGLGERERKSIAENYQRRRADAVRMMEYEIAEAMAKTRRGQDGRISLATDDLEDAAEA